MNKSLVLDMCRAALQKKISSQEKSLRETESIVRDAPGANVSHSDTSRFQYGNQHLGQQKILEETRMCLTSIEEGLRVCDKIGPGALVCLEDELGNQSWFLILSKANAMTVTIDNVIITAISIEAPFSKTMLKHVADDEIKFREKLFFVIDVQ